MVAQEDYSVHELPSPAQCNLVRPRYLRGLQAAANVQGLQWLCAVSRAAGGKGAGGRAGGDQGWGGAPKAECATC
jgi:hypothetical protein